MNDGMDVVGEKPKPTEIQQLLQPLTELSTNKHNDTFDTAVNKANCVYTLLEQSGLFKQTQSIEICYTVQIITDNNFAVLQKMITTTLSNPFTLFDLIEQTHNIPISVHMYRCIQVESTNLANDTEQLVGLISSVLGRMTPIIVHI
jgi:hypothetical protein